MDTVRHRRLDFLGVPIDILPEEEASSVIEKMLEQGKSDQILFLRFSDLFRARRNQEYKKAVNEASLVIPLSKRIQRGVSFVFGEKPIIYKPFDLIIRIFGVVEKKRKSAYLLGSTKKRMQRSHKNLRDSFPGVTFVGRFAGYYEKNMEQDIILAIKKASPSFLLAGRGLKGRELWLYRNKEKMNSSIMLWDPHCYEVFAGSRTKPSHSPLSQFALGLMKMIVMPWRVLLLFRFLWYLLLLLRAKSKRKKGEAHS